MDLGEVISLLGSQIAGEIRLENQTANTYMHAVGRLMKHAARWSSVSAAGIKCETRFQTATAGVQRCGAPAIAACVICGHPTCFDHSMVSPRDGTVICFGCIGQLHRTVKIGDQNVHSGQAADQSAQGSCCTCPNPFECSPDCPVPEHRQAAQATRKDPEKLRREHLGTLGLGTDPSWREIQTAYKQLARQHHPDRCKTGKKKAAHERMAKINAAYSWLNENRKAA